MAKLEYTNYIRRTICIGGNCIAADIMNAVKIRIPSPVDNISGFNIWKSHLLFDGSIYKSLFKESYDVRPSTEREKEKYFYWDKVYSFNHNFHIVHNNFDDAQFKKSLKQRIKLFQTYYKMSKEEDSLWYVYSLDNDDENIDEKFMLQILQTIPECCVDRLICIAMRTKNKLFEKYFKYYLEFEEKDFNWHDKKQANGIIQLYEDQFNLRFDLSRTTSRINK